MSTVTPNGKNTWNKKRQHSYLILLSYLIPFDVIISWNCAKECDDHNDDNNNINFQSSLLFVRFQVLTAASMKFRFVFWDQGDDNVGSTYLWNVGRQLFYTAVHPRRQIWTSLLLYSMTHSFHGISTIQEDTQDAVCVKLQPERMLSHLETLALRTYRPHFKPHNLTASSRINVYGWYGTLHIEASAVFIMQ
jgi:hypothetical protein